MKKYLILCLTLLLFAFPRLKATHYVGAEAQYEQIGCTLRIDLSYFAHCVSTTTLWTLNDSISGYPNACGTISPIGTWVQHPPVEVTPVCPQIITSCTSVGASITGIEEREYSRFFDVCASTCSLFLYQWRDCCRNGAITQIPPNQGISGHIAGPLLSGVSNRGPEFPTLPPFFIPAGQSSQVSIAGFDPDGDSLAYSLGPCDVDYGQSCIYQAGSSPNQPLGISWIIHLDAASGNLSFTPNPGNPVVSILCVYVEEWRNGVLIGTSVRDFQVSTYSGINNIAPTPVNVSQASVQAQVQGDTIYTCAGNQVCLDFSPSDPDPGDSLLIYWDQGLNGASFFDPNQPAVQDSIYGLNPQGRLCFTPPQSGVFTFTIFVQDNACPLPGITSKTFRLIANNQQGSNATANQVSCSSYLLQASACGGSGNYTYQWQVGSVTGSGDSLLFTAPGTGSYPWECIISDGVSLNDTLRDTFSLFSSPAPVIVFADSTVDTCGGPGSSLIVAAASYASYNWSTGSSNDSITVNAPDWVWVEVSDNNGCFYRDSLFIQASPPDIQGQVSSSQSLPLANQRIYLIKYDPVLQRLNAIDTTFTDANGNYHFCEVTDSVVLIKAAPDSMSYPNELPTYANGVLFWNQGSPFSFQNVPQTVNFSTLPGANPGGSGFIGGLVSQGANKTSGVGDPVEGLNVVLVDQQSGLPLQTAVTDANGYFSFADLPLGNYKVAADFPGVDEVNVPVISIDGQNQVRDSLDFRLHSTYFEWVIANNTGIFAGKDVHFGVYPHPASPQSHLLLELAQGQEIKIDLVNIQGISYPLAPNSYLGAGKHRFQLPEGLPKGIYFARLQGKGLERVLKIVIW